MIASCPHCQSGFYIAPDLAGKVLNCSKCKKQVRAPDRRSGLPSQGPPADGIPYALITETRSEMEERLKNETEAKLEIEKKLKQVLEEKAQAEERAKAEAQIRAELEAKLKAAAEGGIITDPQAMANIESKLKEATDARAKAEGDSAAKADIEKLLQGELETRTKAENQLKTEISAKRKIQAQLEEEIKARETAEKITSETKIRLQEAEASKRSWRSIDLCRGLKRLTFVLSPVAAIVAGIIAYNHGFVLMSIYDRPVRLPFFADPVYLPLKSLAFSAGGFIAAWAVYLVLSFIIKGFGHQAVSPAAKQRSYQQQNEEILSAGPTRIWRSS